MKAQVALEFLVFFLIFMFLLLVVAVANFQKTGEIRVAREVIEADRLIALAADRINTVLLEGEGFSAALYLPESIGAANYSISINGSAAYIVLREKYYARRLMTDRVQGQLAPGSNTMRNSGGNIIITQTD